MINIKTFTFNSFQVNTYLLFDETNSAIIIDPACNGDNEFNMLSGFISENNLKLEKIINTHGHIDHIVGVKKVSDEFEVPFFIHKDDNFLLEMAPQMGALFGFDVDDVKKPDGFINEGEKITFGSSALIPIHVPGHSPGSIVYYCEENAFAIVGDVLFAGSIGRTDLPGGNYELLISGISSKLMSLPPDTKVYSGHGTETSIKQEHDTNPFLA